jgi:hypothetical protein
MPRYAESMANVTPWSTETSGARACANPLTGTPAFRLSMAAFHTTPLASREKMRAKYRETRVSMTNVAGGDMGMYVSEEVAANDDCAVMSGAPTGRYVTESATYRVKFRREMTVGDAVSER